MILSLAQIKVYQNLDPPLTLSIMSDNHNKKFELTFFPRYLTRTPFFQFSVYKRAKFPRWFSAQISPFDVR